MTREETKFKIDCQSKVLFRRDEIVSLIDKIYDDFEKGKWISAEDELPDRRCLMKIIDKDGIKDVVVGIPFSEPNGEFFAVRAEIFPIECLVAWMPISEPTDDWKWED